MFVRLVAAAVFKDIYHGPRTGQQRHERGVPRADQRRRLVAVTDYVREWLFGYAHIVGYTDAAVALAKQIAEETGQAPDEAAWRSRKNPRWDTLIGEKYLKESSGRDALNLAGDGDEAAMAWIRARDWGESRNSPGTDLTQSLSLK